MKRFLLGALLVGMLASTAMASPQLYETATDNLHHGNYQQAFLQYLDSCKTGYLPSCDMVSISEYGFDKKGSQEDAIKWVKILLANKSLHNYGVWLAKNYIHFFTEAHMDTTELKKLIKGDL